jgi:hypothetical protein
MNFNIVQIKFFHTYIFGNKSKTSSIYCSVRNTDVIFVYNAYDLMTVIFNASGDRCAV